MIDTILFTKKHLEGSHINIDNASQDELLEAILSNNTEDYKLFLDKCHQISKKFAEDENKEEGAAEKILELSIEDRYGCGLWNPYHETVTFPEVPIAFTLLFQRPSFYGNHDLSVSTELHSSESLDYAQFIVLNDENEDIVNLKFNPAKDWKECMVLNEEIFDETFFSLVGSDDSKKLFVEYQKPKDGSYMDTGEQMFPLSKVKKIGGPTTFKTDNCLFFLKYHIDEVRKIAPKGANAYLIIGDVQGRDNVTVPIQFYHAVPITKQRILRSKEVMDNLNLLLGINNILIPA